MNILTIDTATGLEIVSVETERGLFDHSGFLSQSHSITLTENITHCLNDAGIEFSEIGLMGVGIGPGSFTGIRIAVTTARMFAQILGIPLIGLPTPLIYAASVEAQPEENILIAFDARKNRVFGALYRKSAGSLFPEEIIPSGDYPLQDLISYSDTDELIHCVGDGISRYRETLKSEINKCRYLEKFIPQAGVTSALVRDIYQKGQGEKFSYNRVVPLYTRKSDAEAARG